MPTYDYICDACGHEFEAFESIKADAQKDCPECKTPKLRRKIGAGAAILFKGSGFYQTDYRSESYKKAAKAEKSSSEPSGGSKSEGRRASLRRPTRASQAQRPPRPRRVRPTGLSDDQGALSDLLEGLHHRQARRSALVPLLFGSLPAHRPGAMDRRGLRDPGASRFPYR